MILEFNKEHLITALSTVIRAIPVRTTNPILECVLFDAEAGGRIHLAVNDGELGIETDCEGTVLEPGRFAVDAKLIHEIVRKFDGTDSAVTIMTNDDFAATVSCEEAVFQIQGRDGEEFSYLPAVERDRYICLSQYTLKDAIRTTIFSAAFNDSNKMMGSQFIQVRENQVRFVALDGHRVAIRNITMKENYGNAAVIVPGKAISEVAKILRDDNESDVVIYFSKNFVLFEFDRTTVMSRLVDGEYFRIDHMISRNYELKLSVNRTRLAANIDRASILIRESDHKPIVFDIRGQKMNIRVKSAFGTMDGEVPCAQEGKDLTIAFNPKYMLDAIRAVEDETVDLYFTNPKAPCYIRNEEETYLYIILPVNFVV